MMPRFVALLLALLLPLAAGAGQLTGTATYRERIALPPEAQFRAILYDVSNDGRVEIGRFTAPGDAGPPYAFAIDFDDAAAPASGRYALHAEIMWQGEPYVAATTMLDGLPATGAAPDLVMVRPEAAGMEGAADEMPTLAAHGLRLPASFKGTVEARGGPVDWHLALWPDQVFQLTRTFAGDDGTPRRMSGLGRWVADPVANALVLRDGTETPLMVARAGQDALQVLDAETGDRLEGQLISGGTFDLPQLEGMMITGMMTYMADAPMIEECQTGMRFPLAQEGAYLALESAYLADRAEPGAPLNVMLEGSITLREAMEGPDRQTVTVDRFIRTRPDVSCARERAAPNLRNTYWRLDELEGEPFPAGAAPQEAYLVLEEGAPAAYSATLGCNRMRGTYEMEGERLTFSPGASTMMACAPPLDKLEQQFGAALSQVTGYVTEDDTLVLHDAEGTKRAIFSALYF